MFRQVIGTLAVFALSAAAAQGQPAHSSSGTPTQEQRIGDLERLGGTVFHAHGTCCGGESQPDENRG